jgi:hypothetical protein
MAARKKSAKKTAGKKATGSKAGARKKAPAKKKAAASKPAKAPAKARASKPRTSSDASPVAAAKPTPVAVRRPAAPERPAAPPGTMSAEQVTLANVMSLRPRIHVGFKPSAFADAKRALADARYASIEEAARAVATKAIEISNDPRQDPFGRH